MSDGHPMYMPPGSKTSSKPPSKVSTLLEMEPDVQFTVVVTSLPLEVDLISY